MSSDSPPRERRRCAATIRLQRRDRDRAGQYLITYSNPVAVVWCANRARLSVPQTDVLLCFAADCIRDRGSHCESVRYPWRLLRAASDFSAAMRYAPHEIFGEDADGGA